jgi:uncharacterized protein (DUF2225 family)
MQFIPTYSEQASKQALCITLTRHLHLPRDQDQGTIYIAAIMEEQEDEKKTKKIRRGQQDPHHKFHAHACTGSSATYAKPK